MSFRHSPTLSSRSVKSAGVSDYSRAQVFHPFSYESSNREPPLTPAFGSIGATRSPRTGKDKKAEKFDLDVHEFITRLKRSKHYGSSAVAKDTCCLLRTVIIKGKFATIQDLLDTVRDVGRELIQSRPLELVIGNIVRRVLFIIRREFAMLQREERREAEETRRLQLLSQANVANTSNASNAANASNPDAPFSSILDGVGGGTLSSGDGLSVHLSEQQKKLLAIRGTHSQMQVLKSSTAQTSGSTQNSQTLRRHSSMRTIASGVNPNAAQSCPATEHVSPKDTKDSKDSKEEPLGMASHSGFDVNKGKGSISPKTADVVESDVAAKNVLFGTKEATQGTHASEGRMSEFSLGTPFEGNGGEQELALGDADVAAAAQSNASIGSSSSASSSGSATPPEEIVEDVNRMNPSLLDMFHAKDELDYSCVFKSRFKSTFINEINLLKDEISNVYDEIGEYSVEHIHSNEIVLTYGSSRTVLHFLKHASRNRAFEVFIAESAPSLTGQKMARDLTSECPYDEKNETGIRSVTVISDASIFAIMSRVNKVIIGTHCVLANGGLLTHSGTHQLALAARYHRVPVVVVTGLYKLSPLYAFDQDTFNEQGASQSIMRYDEMGKFDDVVSIVNPVFDFVGPEFVDLLITNNGGYSPSYIYYLLRDYYNAFDYDL